MPALALSTKEQIVLAAERLYAQHGLDGVSLRQIGAAAHNANKSAVQYHFGSKDRLVQAIFEYRLPRLQERRSLLIAERSEHDLRSWIGCQIRAVFEQGELDGSQYMRFIAMLHRYGRVDVFESLPAAVLEVTRAFQRQLKSYLADFPEPFRSHRIAQAMGLIVHAASNRERARADNQPLLPLTVEIADLTDGMVGFLEAPMSPATLTALDEIGLDTPTLADAPRGDI